MKKLTLLLLSLFLLSGSYAQDDEFQTIFGGEDFSISGFGGPFMQFNTVTGNFAHMMGGGGGIIVNKKILFGGYGIGKTNSILINEKEIDPTAFAAAYLNGNESEIPNVGLDFGHGGLFAGYVLNGNAPVHPTFILNAGWGTASVGKSLEFPIYSDNIFVLNPMVELELNITRFFKVGVGANYTLVSGLNMVGYKDKDFSSPGASLSFRFGWF